MPQKSVLENACTRYNTRITIYGSSHYIVTCFNKRVFNPDKIPIEKPIKLRTTYEKSQDKQKRNDSMLRSKEKITEICYTNEWEYFITLTLNPENIDRYNRKEVLRYIKNWLSNRVRLNDMKYLIIPELHKDGAIHFHGLIKGKGLKFTDSGYKTDRGQTIYNFDNWKLGFTTAVKIDETPEKVFSYILKYVTKGNMSVYAKSYFAGGNGLCREAPKQYANIVYSDADGKEYKIDEANLLVKYNRVNIGGVNNAD